MNLLDETTEKLRHSRMPMKKIARGAGVSERQLYKLRSGEAVNPSCLFVQTVYDYLESVAVTASAT